MTQTLPAFLTSILTALTPIKDHRPHEWCGWQMRHEVSIDPGPEYNLARAWTRWGSPTLAHVGAVVVWPHHVGRIVSGDCGAGEWMVKSGNDGGQVRMRCLSVRGAIAFRE